MAQPKLLLILNPTAGTMRAKNALFPLVNTFCRSEYQVSVHVTACRGDARQVCKDRASAYDLIVCCGGDGTLNEVIDGLIESGSDTALGYIPMGSTNDFAQSLKLPLQPQKAAQAVVSGAEDRMDVGVFNGNRRFAYIASFGAFTAASYSAPQASKNALGHFAYILEGIKELSSIQSYTIQVETDDRNFEGEYVFGAVCNSTSVAGLVRLNKGLVDMSDGLFEVILVKQPRTVADLHKIVLSLNTGEFDKNMFEFFKTRSITFRCQKPMAWSLDGEYQEGAQTVTVENRHHALLLRH